MPGGSPFRAWSAHGEDVHGVDVPAFDESFAGDDAETSAAGEDAGIGSRAGFPLVFAGLAAFGLGIGAFLWGQSAPGMSKYVWREVAGATVGLALPLFLLGVQTALPCRRWARIVAAVGLVAAAAAVAVFIWLYPYHWNVRGRDGSALGLVPYGAGILLMGSGAFMALLDAYLDLREGKPLGTHARAAEDPVTEEEIARDLAEASARSKLTWGGMFDSQHPALRITPATAPAAQVLTGAIGKRYTLADQPITPAVDRLKAFRGTVVTASEDVGDVPDSAAALVAMRQSREAEAVSVAAEPLMERMMRNMRAWLSPWGEGGHESVKPPAAAEVHFELVGRVERKDQWSVTEPGAAAFAALLEREDDDPARSRTAPAPEDDPAVR